MIWWWLWGDAGNSDLLLKESVQLPRKLVRGQDVWLGKGAEQTRQILKCMWCGQSFRSLAEMTTHMQQTQHYTNIISQEQIISWKAADDKHSSTANHVNAVLTCKVCDQVSILIFILIFILFLIIYSLFIHIYLLFIHYSFIIYLIIYLFIYLFIYLLFIIHLLFIYLSISYYSFIIYSFIIHLLFIIYYLLFIIHLLFIYLFISYYSFIIYSFIY